jgi:hypothetical protein
MADDKKKTGYQDRAKIDKNDPSEVGQAARKLGTSPAKIHEAIEQAGSGRKKVEEYVKKSQKK